MDREWNPMKQAFGDKYFNQYNQGVGRDLFGSVGHNQGVKLFAQNVPAALGQEGFRNLFSEYGTVVDSKLIAPREDSQSTIGFVTMKSVVDANTAISKLDKKKIMRFTLRVSPALTDEEKEKRRRLKQKESEFYNSILGNNANAEDDAAAVSSSSSKNSAVRQSLKQPGIEGKGTGSPGLDLDRIEWHSLSKAAEEGNRMVPKLAISVGRGSPRKVQEKGDSIHLPHEDFLQSLGRGKAAQPQARSVGLLGPGPERGASYQYHQEPGMFGRGKSTDAARGNRQVGSSGMGLLPVPARPQPSRSTIIEPPKSTQVEGVRLCVFCHKRGCVNLCSRCKMYYCSVDCQKKDWSRHRNICIAVGDGLRNNSSATNALNSSNSSRKSVKSCETDTESVMSPNKNKHENKMGKRNYDSDTAEGRAPNTNKNISNKNAVRGKDRKQSSLVMKNHAWRSSDNSGDLSSSEDEQASSQHNKEKYSSNCVQSASTASSMKENVKPAKISSKISGNDDSPSSKQQDLSKEAAKAEVQPSQAVDGGSSTDTNMRVMSLEAGNASTFTPEISLPEGSSGQAYVTYFESPYKFWICLHDYMESFSELMVFMDQHFSKGVTSKAMRPKVGEMYAALAMDEWSRLRVVSVQEQDVTVYFVDYGNTATVKWSDLRPLTEDMLMVPAQAVCCCVSKMKPVNSDSWSEEVCTAVQTWLGTPLTKAVTFQVVTVKGSIHAVNILLDGESMSEMLFSRKMGEKVFGNPGLFDGVRTQRKESRFMVDSLPPRIPECNVGDKLSVVLTDIQSAERFAVVSSASSASVDELGVLLQTEKLDEKGPYRPIKGELVAGKFSEDGNWYRSEVINVQNDSFTLFFLDYGNTEVQVTSNIRQLKASRLTKIPAQAIICSLHGLKIPGHVGEQDVLKEFKQLLAHNYLDETGGLSLIVKGKMDGHMLVDFEADSGSSFSDALRNRLAELYKVASTELIKALSPKVKLSPKQTQENTRKPEKKLNSSPKIEQNSVADIDVETFPQVGGETIRVNVSFVKDCSEFYVRLEQFHGAFINMMRDLNTNVDKSPVALSPTVGKLVAVQFSQDHIWYRGKVEKIDGTNYQVHFIDYGNCDVVGGQSLRELPPSVCQLSVQAIKCHLSGNLAQVSEAMHQAFKQQIEDMCVDVKVVGRDSSGFSVQMFVDGSDLGKLIFGEDDTREVAAVSAPKHIPIHKLEPNVPIPVECVNMISPAEFYVQVSEHIPAAVETTLRLKARLEEMPQPVKAVAPGDFVAGKFSQDSDVIWYRVRVESVCGDRCTIFFVDYGNFEETSVAGLMQLAPEDFKTPACTIKCRLSNSKAPSAELIKKFLELGPSQIVSIQVISQDDECVVDILNGDGKSITNLFTEQIISPPRPQTQMSLKPDTSKKSPSQQAQRQSIKTETLPCSGEVVPVVITHVESCSHLYVSRKVEHLQSQLLQLMVKLNTLGHSLPELASPTPGALCAAKFSQDDSWYRAQIDEVLNSATAIIHFIDYGNAEETVIAELKEMPKELLQLPAQAIRLCLQGYEDTAGDRLNSETAKCSGKLKEELLEKQVNVKVVDRKNNIWIVKMENEHGECIGSKYKPIHSQATPNLSDLIFETPPQKEFDGVIFHINNFSDFYIQRTEPEELKELQRMSQELKQDVSKLAAGVCCEPVVDGIYTSEYQGSWYRCVVQEVKGQGVHVRYLDYGNTEEIPVSHLRPINQERLAMPVRLIKCKLNGVIPVQPNWQSDGISQYFEILQQSLIHVIVEGEEGDTLLVSLHLGDNANRVNVASDVVAVNFAKFDDQANKKKDEEFQSEGAIGPKDQEEVAEEEDDEELELQRKIQELQKQLELSQQKKNKFKR